MPQPPKPLQPGRSARDWFGAELRHWRTQRGLTQDQLGALVHVSGDLIAKIEKAVRACDPHLAEALDTELETGGVLARALVRVRAEADSRAADADNAAAAPRNRGPRPETVGVPVPSGSSLPDTGPGADVGGVIRVPCRTADGRIIFVTMPRRALLHGGATGAALFTATPPVSEPLFRPIGGQAAFVSERHPVEHLRQFRRALVNCDNLLGSVLLIDTVRDHIALIQRLRRDASGADRKALLQVQAEYAEFCGWLHQDAGDQRAAQYWTDRALDWSHASGGQETIVYIMIRKAQLAGDRRDPADAVDLAEAAQNMALPRGRLSAMSSLSSAHGHALSGDAAACRRTYDRVVGMMDDLAVDSPHRRGWWLDTPHVQAQRAHALSLIGDHQAAESGFDKAIEEISPTYRRDRGFFLSQAAVAHARAGHPELAARRALQALPIAAQTGSARIFRELSVLDAQMRQWRAVPDVLEFRDALDSLIAHES
ncbi:helix-turn-helix transcriptional regulator [Streptomyces sp. B1866]|uniref:helix-turn-helix domain-containing protein n=1 Tax=Streptomyces sp. B1866 TaxID=3075431 RepID=UPI00288D040F|nr:helix-turn-helix transcriptional regulator [Streptomyces sp. B1866]MDT3397784.1 helix-turn-helix transcriptional regulator [Streptomyces sp. B1866]